MQANKQVFFFRSHNVTLQVLPELQCSFGGRDTEHDTAICCLRRATSTKTSGEKTYAPAMPWHVGRRVKDFAC